MVAVKNNSVKQATINNFFGSLIFELTKLVTTCAIYKMLPQTDYVNFFTFYALFIAASKYIDGGVTYACAPFFGEIKKSQAHCLRYIIITLIQQAVVMTLVIGGGIIAIMFKIFNGAHFFLMTILLITECLNNAMRYFINLANLAHLIISREIILYLITNAMTIVLCILQSDYRILLGITLVYNLALFFIMTKTSLFFYNTLPSTPNPIGKNKFTLITHKNVFFTRLFNATHRIIKGVYTTHCLTPLFLIMYKNHPLVALYHVFISGVASLASIIKMTMGFSSSRILKRNIHPVNSFILSSTLWIGVIIAIYSGGIYVYCSQYHPASQSLVIHAAYIIAVFECFFIPLEFAYNTRLQGNTFISIRLAELCLSLFIIALITSTSSSLSSLSASTLFILIIIRILALIISLYLLFQK